MAYMIPNFVQLAHFSKKAPENHNICIKNLNGKYAHVYKGRKWVKMLKSEVIDDLIFGHEMSIRSWADDEERDPKLLKEYEHYENEKEKSAELVNKIKEEIGLVLYNNRDLIKTD